jgi:signal peptidase I
MNFDLELMLVIGTLLTGGIWLIDRFFFEQRRKKAAFMAAHPSSAQTAQAGVEQPYRDPWYVEYSKSFFPVLFIVLVLRAFVAEPFRIPSGSMMPTLLVGDFILVNKFAYDLRLPVLHTKLFETGDPERGDVVVFRYPENPSDDYIKRVVGVPGDRITYYDKVLFINGERAPQQPIGRYEGVGSGGSMTGALVLEERLGDITHQILIEPNNPGIQAQYVVPPNSYFVMGDNRDNSNDSRFWGFVPDQNLVGEAFMIWLNWDIAGGVFDYSRIGNSID